MDLEDRIEKYKEVTNNIDLNQEKIIDGLENKSSEEVLGDAKKFLDLCEVFDIDAGNMESNIQEEKDKIIEEISSLNNNELKEIKSIIDTDDLMSDFSLIRKRLRENIESTSILLTKFGRDLSTSHAEDVSGQMLMGYSELIKSANTSMKLLIETYSSVAKTQTEIKKLINSNKTIDNESNIHNEQTNIINLVGSPADILEMLKEN